MMNQEREINPFLEFQIRNIHNDIASKLFGGIFSDLTTDEQIVVTAYVQNLLLYNHFINTDEKWNENPINKKGYDDI